MFKQLLVTANNSNSLMEYSNNDFRLIILKCPLLSNKTVLHYSACAWLNHVVSFLLDLFTLSIPLVS